MPAKTIASPLEQVLTQIRAEASNEDTSGLTPDDLDMLGRNLWEWAETKNAGQQGLRVVRDVRGANRALGLSALEATGPDMPFLVDSLMNECAAQRLSPKAMFHPVLKMPGGARQSVIQILLPPLSKKEAGELEAGARKTLADVDASVADYQALRALMEREAEKIRGHAFLEASDREEAAAFLDWLGAEHFVFLGAREYTFATGKGGAVLAEEPEMVEGSNLGLLRDESRNVLTREAEPLILTPEVSEMLAEPFPLVIAKSTLVSRVHRRVRADYIGVKHYDKTGNVIGEVRFLGLFTAEAYDETARSIPFIRRRVAKVIAASGATPGGHSAKALANILETWPRDELFQTNSATLTGIMLGVLHLIGRPRTRLFTRLDPFGRFVSAMVYVPREAYDTDLRQRLCMMLCEAYQGDLLRFQPYFDAGPMARVHIQIELKPGHKQPDLAQLEQRVVDLSLTWDDAFRKALASSDLIGGETDGARAFRGSFNAAYREAFRPQEALIDVAEMRYLAEDAPVRARAYRKNDDENFAIRVKIYSRKGAIALSDCVPIFENMGLFVKFETGYPVRPTEKPAPDAPEVYWVHDLYMHTLDGQALDLQTVGAALEAAFVAVWRGRADNDGFNRLILAAGADWREAALMRTLSAYRRQCGMGELAETQIAALEAYPEIARQILDLFAARFDPGRSGTLKVRAKACAAGYAAIEESLQSVASLQDDQALRRLADLVMALQRTNFYHKDEGGHAPVFISFKVASQELADLPEPKPYREIFMNCPQVEGVHLRFGPVARGGLRWSDRPADYRTEVLGLVKAQQVKNAVIVPVGSKGGFLPKHLPARNHRDAWAAAGLSAYKVFISSLLQLTDNLEGGKLVHPGNSVIWDGEDPYLVVAADKGTATFSDTANAISEAHGFWLGDAFASGGSAGYDHKKMGITARGGWEAVKRHFREMGKDIQAEPFSVIGCGDMGGDVFGNGMLLSKQTRLLAAYNHLHIFIDPNPEDTQKTWKERKRLFDMRGGWDAYDKKLISKGGGVFERSAKSIRLTPEIKALSGLAKDKVTPDELIHALLKADVELLWFGGIGTYVIASHESHSDAGDRANDALRVTARELKASVIGEGANLGMTQAARVEFALRGGRINTDAIDNSAGVDSSDHEVNIKILATEAIRGGQLKPGRRNALLAEMTDEVGAHVLAHNYQQTSALTLAQSSASADHEANERLMLALEKRGVLSRSVEGLPSSADMKARGDAGEWLTRPELAVLLAWSKIVLFDDIVASDLPDDPYFQDVLAAYFPSPINQYKEAMANHRLRREIIATVIANRTLDLGGPATMHRFIEESGADGARAACLIEAARAVMEIDTYNTQIDKLDNKVPAVLQTKLKLAGVDAVMQLAHWMDAMYAGLAAGEIVASATQPLSEFAETLGETQSAFVRASLLRKASAFVKAGAPDKLARRATLLGNYATGLVIADCAAQIGRPVKEVAKAYFEIGDSLRLDRLRGTAIEGLPKATYWDRIAARRVLDDLTRQQAQATVRAFEAGSVKSWLEARSAARRQLTARLISVGRSKKWSFARLSLAADAVRQFMQE